MSAYKSGARRSLIAEKFLSITIAACPGKGVAHKFIGASQSQALFFEWIWTPLKKSISVLITSLIFNVVLWKVNGPTLLPSSSWLPTWRLCRGLCGVTCKCNTFGLFTRPSAVCLGRSFPACFVIIHFTHFRRKLWGEIREHSRGRSRNLSVLCTFYRNNPETNNIRMFSYLLKLSLQPQREIQRCAEQYRGPEDKRVNIQYTHIV